MRCAPCASLFVALTVFITRCQAQVNVFDVNGSGGGSTDIQGLSSTNEGSQVANTVNSGGGNSRQPGRQNLQRNYGPNGNFRRNGNMGPRRNLRPNENFGHDGSFGSYGSFGSQGNFGSHGNFGSQGNFGSGANYRLNGIFVPFGVLTPGYDYYNYQYGYNNPNVPAF